MKCVYCNKQTINEPMYVVFKVIGPKRKPIGHCCDECDAKGMALYIKAVEHGGSNHAVLNQSSNIPACHA